MPDAAFVCIDNAVDAYCAGGDYEDAAALLQEFAARVPGHVPSLQKLIEICVDGKLESAMQDAQAQLADAYLQTGQAAEARIIAEDLVAREPWETAHIERFRRALSMLKVWDPDTVIADRLGGQTPFVAKDPFVDERAAAEAAAPPPEPPAEPAAPPAPVTLRLVTPAAAPPAAKAAGHDEIDLTTALGGLSSAAAPPVPQAPAPVPVPAARAGPAVGLDADAKAKLDSVFQNVRGRVARHGMDHSAHHMTLARTYLEMGMTNEAIDALKNAAKSPPRRYEAASQLGRLYRDRGDAASAIEWLERASQAPAPTPEDGRQLLYDLGVLLEDTGATAHALALFLSLRSEAGEYRDVSQRVDRLAKVQTGG
jgi:tetratricopeptide (TPR) repeat protein